MNNSEGEGGGTYDLESATWHSVNVVFAQLDLDVGPETVTEMAKEMGIESPLQSVPAEGIGGLAIGVTPLEMADAYATLASGGIHHDPTAVSKVEFPDGKVDDFEKDSGKRVLTEGQAYEVTRILEGVITQGTGAGYTSMGCSSAAGKTGTSEELSDAWFVGYTPLFSTAVWVGHPTTREYTGFGGPTAGPIWANYMSEAVEGDCPEFEAGSAPELEGLDSDHTSSSSYDGYEEEESYEGEEAEDEGKEMNKGGDEGGEEATPEPEPEPTPNPPRRRNPRRHPPPAAASAPADRRLRDSGPYEGPNLGEVIPRGVVRGNRSAPVRDAPRCPKRSSTNQRPIPYATATAVETANSSAGALLPEIQFPISSNR